MKSIVIVFCFFNFLTVVCPAVGLEKDQEGTRVGDIVYTPGQYNLRSGNGMERSRRSPIVNNQLWPNGIIPYSVDTEDCQKGDLKNKLTCHIFKTMLHSAMAKWMNKTCIQFKESKARSRVSITTSKDGCSSYKGRKGGEQSLKLENECVAGAILQLLGQTIGLIKVDANNPDTKNHISAEDIVTVHLAYKCPGCLNGGILDGNRCRCPDNFHGEKCENCVVPKLPITCVNFMNPLGSVTPNRITPAP